jgi:TrmH family RNA methyltransferase
MITSLANPKVKLLRSLVERKGRREHGLFLVEGVRLMEEAVRSGAPPRLVVFDPDLLQDDRTRRLIQAIPSDIREAARPFVIEKASDTVSPQGILGAFPLPRSGRPSGNPILVLDGVRDPGNLGTIMRTAEAAGVKTVVAGPNTVDPFIPKAVRAGMGAHFRLTVIAAPDWEAVDAIAAESIGTVAVPRGGVEYDELDWSVSRTLYLGGEADGSGAEAMARADDRVTIPMAAGVESINVSAAAAVLLFEAHRQQNTRLRRRG